VSAWALELDAGDIASLGRLRLERGLEACQQGDRLWLRGGNLDESLALRVRQLPALERYTVLSDQALVAEGHQVPHGYLPQGPWLPLAELIEIARPESGSAAHENGVLNTWMPASLVLVRDDLIREPNLLLARIDLWSDYAAAAPQIRLNRWSFAANDCGEVLIRGTPLPPIAGQRFVEIEGVAVEAGWMWSPRVEPVVLRQKLELAADDLVLLRSDGEAIGAVRAEIIPAASFVKATRSAVRLTERGASP
jgi:hypothetical protein